MLILLYVFFTNNGKKKVLNYDKCVKMVQLGERIHCE